MLFIFNYNSSSNFFSIIYTLTIFHITNSYHYFSFPTAISLKNKDILIIHQLGVTVCDSTFKHIKKNVYNFASEEEQISNEEKLSRISIVKFDDGYIFCIIIDKLYIFDSEGNFKNRTESLIPNGVTENLIFTLTPDVVEDGYYYFLVGYIYQKSLYLDYYKYNSEGKEKIERIAYLENYYETSSYKILDIGLSCEFLYYKYSGIIYNIIACAYYTCNSHYELSISTFIINGNSNQEALNSDHINREYINYEIKCIKTSVTSDHLSSIFCFYLSNGELFCYTYSLNHIIDLIYSYQIDCLQKYYGLKVDYFKENNEFIVSCLADIGRIQVGKFTDDLKEVAPDEIIKYEDCEYIYGYSLIYNEIIKDYYVISDVKCNNTKYPFQPLNGSLIKEEEEAEEEKEIEEELEKESEQIKEEMEEEEELGEGKEEKEEDKEEEEEENRN